MFIRALAAVLAMGLRSNIASIGTNHHIVRCKGYKGSKLVKFGKKKTMRLIGKLVCGGVKKGKQRYLWMRGDLKLLILGQQQAHARDHRDCMTSTI